MRSYCFHQPNNDKIIECKTNSSYFCKIKNIKDDYYSNYNTLCKLLSWNIIKSQYLVHNISFRIGYRASLSKCMLLSSRRKDGDTGKFIILLMSVVFSLYSPPSLHVRPINKVICMIWYEFNFFNNCFLKYCRFQLH